MKLMSWRTSRARRLLAFVLFLLLFTTGSWARSANRDAPHKDSTRSAVPQRTASEGSEKTERGEARGPRVLEMRLVELIETEQIKEAQRLVRESKAEGAELAKLGAFLYHAVWDFQRAAPDLERTHELEPRNAPIALRLAEVYVWQQRTAGARRILDAFPVRSLEREPRPWELLGHRALVLAWLRQRDQAEKQLMQVLARPTLPAVIRTRYHVRLAELVAWDGDTDGALRLLSLEPRSVDAMLLQGRIQEWRGEYALARDTYSRALQLHPGNTRLEAHLEALAWLK